MVTVANAAAVAEGSVLVWQGFNTMSNSAKRLAMLNKGNNKKSKSGSGKEKATDIPSWAKGNKPLKGENGKDFATRLMNEKYGIGNYKTGPGSEFSKLQKYGNRAFE
jgi:hypothetical protein